MLSKGCKLNIVNLTEAEFKSTYPELMKDFPYDGKNVDEHDLGLIVGQICEPGSRYNFTDYLFTAAPGLFGLFDGFAFPTGMCLYSLFTL